MKYIGNKLRLLNFIDQGVRALKVPPGGTFIDIFSGTTNVAQYFKKKGYRIISNDFMTYSYVAQYAFIKNNEYPLFTKLLSKLNINSIDKLDRTAPLRLVIDYLNKIPSKRGFIFKNYAPSGEFARMYFSDENAQKIDAIRDILDLWKFGGVITENEFNILLMALIDGADYVANISGTYGAYLKIWRAMALKSLYLKPPVLIESSLEHQIYKEDANELIRNIRGDILYIDPPYNNRQYAPNFHILETLALWDSPSIKGKTGLRPYEKQKSKYSQRSFCQQVFSDLILHADVDYILLSYNSEGIIPEEFILETLKSRGEVEKYSMEYRRFRTERDHDKRHYKSKDNKVTERMYILKIKY